MHNRPLLFSILVIVPFFIGCDAGKPKTVKEIPQVEIPDVVVEKPEIIMEMVKAEANVTGKADFAKDGEKDIMSPITVPVGEYFKTKERVVFDMQVPHTMNIYKATHDNKGPQSHEEFMKEIIEAGQIQLPKLPEGQKYIFDPETQTLNVLRPAKQQ